MDIWKSRRIFWERELLDVANGGVKMVKITPFAKYPVHVHPDKTEFAYVVKGPLKMIIGDEILDGNEGDFFIFPRTTKHSIESHSEAECLLLVGAIKN